MRCLGQWITHLFHRAQDAKRGSTFSASKSRSRPFMNPIQALYKPPKVTAFYRWIAFGPLALRKNPALTGTERFISKPIAQPLSIARPSACRTGIVDGNSPNQISNANAACSISMPRPSAHATAPLDDAQRRKGVGSTL